MKSHPRNAPGHGLPLGGGQHPARDTSGGATARNSARRRGWHPRAIEALEGRALLATTLYDPTFGTGGLAVGAVNPSDRGSDVSAVAVQADGKIVTAETNTPNGATNAAPATTPLVIRRYLANGSVDASFGTNGTTVIPLASGSTVANAPHDIAITASGQILVAAEGSIRTTSSSGSVTMTLQDVVARLTSTGALDTTFGTGGEFTLPSSVADANSVVVTTGGRVVVSGVTPSVAGQANSVPEAVLVGLTDAGALDATFGTGGTVAIPGSEPYSEGGGEPDSGPFANVAALRLTSSGQILVALGVSRIDLGVYAHGTTTISRLSADGVLDTTFGTGGTASLVPENDNYLANDMVVQSDGRIVLAGYIEFTHGYGSSGFVVRLLADGSIDSSFPAIITPTPQNYSFNSFGSVAVGSDGIITAVSKGQQLASDTTSKAVVNRYLATGAPDPNFGTNGVADITVPLSAGPTGATSINQLNGPVALLSDGKILIGGSISGIPNYSETVLTQILPTNPPPPPTPKSKAPNDYDGDGKSDLGALLPDYGVFATRTSSNGTSSSQPFGPAGDSTTIPAPGDYDGDGKSDPAVYLPAYGVLAYRPSTGGTDVLTRFGPTGSGNAIPAPGDYDGDGKTDVALFLPGSATFIIDPSGGGNPYAVQFGIPGTGNAIPAPGDYDGSGKTELAVYLPSLGILAYRSATSGVDELVGFGLAGAGQTIPAPGDYDGDGKTDVAAFLPALGLYAERPSSGGADVLIRFGPTGLGAALPVPGDYDGDGKTDVALFLPDSATYAVVPSRGGLPTAAQFGAAGAGNTVPATAVVTSQGSVRTMSLRQASAPPEAATEVPVYLPDDGLAVTTPRKKSIV